MSITRCRFQSGSKDCRTVWARDLDSEKYLHPKASVGLISSIAGQRLSKSQRRKRNPHRAFVAGPGILEQTLNETPDPGLVYKRHLYVNLKPNDIGN